MSDESRRFTDREVALVLKRAAEIEEGVGPSSGGGLSLEDLQEIGREVGISPEAIASAVAGLQGGKGSAFKESSWVWGQPAAHKATHAVRGHLNEEALNRLLHLVDERMESNGALSEALGSIRWTSADRFSSTQVALSPAGGETRITVSEKILPRWKRVFHAIPTAWGVMLGTALSAAFNATGDGTAVFIAISGAAGLLAGRVAWNALSGRSEKRTRLIAADLSREAYNASKAGMLDPPGEESGPTD